MSARGLTVRVATPDEVALIVDWAAREGWNPGRHDATCFRLQDPAGFFIGLEAGEPVSAISAVTYGDAFAFLGFYIVRPDRRGLGYGMATWRRAMSHAAGRPLGLDGVIDQQDNYRKSGFVLAHRNLRFGATVPAPKRAVADVVPADSVAFDLLAAYDRSCFQAARSEFLRNWMSAPGHHARALLRDGRLAGFGVARPCRQGTKIGPLFADDRRAAESLFDSLVLAVGGGSVFVDVPEPNRAAMAWATARGLVPAFETARMYTAPVPVEAPERVFGVTTFELG